MIIGVPKEIKNNENQVAITPAGVKALIKAGHPVLVQKLVGSRSGVTDQEYRNAGASIPDTVKAYWHIAGDSLNSVLPNALR